MWSVLGVETNLVKFPQIFKERVIELSARRKGRPRFLKLIEMAEIKHGFNTQDNIHVFMIDLPEHVEAEDIELIAGMIKKIRKAVKEPLVAFEGEPQLVSFVISAEEEPDVIGKRKQDSAAAAELFHRITSTWDAE
jgi:hypothetical protein